eukprot:1157694-Pelagomonas_calceolata.AAC.17
MPAILRAVTGNALAPPPCLGSGPLLQSSSTSWGAAISTAQLDAAVAGLRKGGSTHASWWADKLVAVLNEVGSIAVKSMFVGLGKFGARSFLPFCLPLGLSANANLISVSYLPFCLPLGLQTKANLVSVSYLPFCLP